MKKRKKARLEVGSFQINDHGFFGSWIHKKHHETTWQAVFAIKNQHGRDIPLDSSGSVKCGAPRSSRPTALRKSHGTQYCLLTFLLSCSFIVRPVCCRQSLGRAGRRPLLQLLQAPRVGPVVQLQRQRRFKDPHIQCRGLARGKKNKIAREKKKRKEERERQKKENENINGNTPFFFFFSFSFSVFFFFFFFFFFF